MTSVADLGQELDKVRAMPAGTPGRPGRAARLAAEYLASGAVQNDFALIDDMNELVSLAGGVPVPVPDWPAVRIALRALWLTRCLQIGRPGYTPAGVLAELDAVGPDVLAHPAARVALSSARSVATWFERARTNDLRPMPPIDVGELVSAAPGSVENTLVRIQRHASAGDAAQKAGDQATAVAEIRAAVRLRSLLPPDHAMGRYLDDLASEVGVLEMPTPGSPSPGSASPALQRSLDELRARVGRPGADAAAQADSLVKLGVAEMMLAESAGQMVHMDRAVDHLCQGVALTPETDRQLPDHLLACGRAILRRYEVWSYNRIGLAAGRSGRAELDRALGMLRRARDLCGGPEHPRWTEVCQALGEALRAAGRTKQGLDAGRDGLRGYTWSVLLQSGTAAATAAGRNASRDAVELARAYLAEGDAAGAALALDAGRGLVLPTAMRFRDRGDRLTELGRPELARQWAVAESDPARTPAVLRREVVELLVGGRPESLDPPNVADISRALDRTGIDVLVYLVPGDEDGDGAAVLVPARDDPTWIRLPGLDLRTAAALHDFVGAGAARGGRRDMATEGVPDPVLGALSDWAWTAGTGRILDHVEAHLRRRTDGPPHLLLVPMGELARVPWHAARRLCGGRRRYAIEDAVFSYAVSARMVCEVASRTDVGRSTEGLFIGDPNTASAAPDLLGARIEAAGIRAAYYPAASYVGRTVDGAPAPDGRGTVEEVADWLATGSGAVLHAACHGVVEPGRGESPTSYLVLADGRPLAAEELVRTLTRRRSRPLALVVLAACSSGVTGRGYDEAYSVGTAFLAAGTRSLISALWAVPDADTTALMYLFHHNLATMAPAAALRAAQLTMLRPGGTVPESMPAALRRRLERGAPARIGSWAGFVHAGR